MMPPIKTSLPRTKKRGRNEPCYCGSGKKFKVCCSDPNFTDVPGIPGLSYSITDEENHPGTEARLTFILGTWDEKHISATSHRIGVQKLKP